MEDNLPVQISENVTLGDDGVYRWKHEINLFKNPSIFFLVWKIFFFIFLVIFLMINVVDLILYPQNMREMFVNNLKFAGYFLAGMTIVVGLGYLIYAAMMKGKYVVRFEMTEKGVNHIQEESQAKKSKAVGRAATVSGILSGRFSSAGAGMAAQRTEMYSDFQRVRKVKAYPRKSLIKLNGYLSRNQVYTAKEDFELVKTFIIEHCPNLDNKN